LKGSRRRMAMRRRAMEAIRVSLDLNMSELLGDCWRVLLKIAGNAGNFAQDGRGFQRIDLGRRWAKANTLALRLKNENI
jgi:hypothetical protein